MILALQLVRFEPVGLFGQLQLPLIFLPLQINLLKSRYGLA